jgi:HlyD family secretion protein
MNRLASPETVSGSKKVLMNKPLDPAALTGAHAAERIKVSPPMRRRAVPRYWLLGGVALLALVAAGVTWWSIGSKTTVRYTLAPVTQGPITPTISATGTVNPELTIIVGTYVSGVIQQLFCDYNTAVKKGQICAKIDPRPYQSQLDQAKANLAVAKATLLKDQAALAYAKISYERQARLVQSNAVSQDVLDNAKNAYAQAQAQIAFDEATIQQRQAALDAAQVNLDYTDIISPVDGIVVSRSVTMGQTVAASFQTPTLFLIATDLTRMEVDTNVSEGDIGDVTLGQKATFTVDAYPKRTFQGTVSQVRQSPQTVQNIVTYDVVISVANPDLDLKPGMTAANRIVVDERISVLRVPNQALRYAPSTQMASAGMTLGPETPGQSHVWVMRDEIPVSVLVETGVEDDVFTEIRSGSIKSGDQVITGERMTTSGQPLIPRLRF